MAADARRQCRHDGVPLRGEPAFAAIADHPAAQHQVLHNKILVSLEPRSGRGSRLQGLFLDTDTRCRLATSPTLAPSWRLRRGSLLHPTWLDIRATLQAFQ